MSLIDEQAAFTMDVVKLVTRANELGYLVTLGEAWRSPEQQEIYVKTGRSKTMESDHLRRLAIDLNFFKNKKLVQDRESLKPLGQFWESLHPKNRWGGSWRGLVDAKKSSFVDVPHWERHV